MKNLVLYWLSLLLLISCNRQKIYNCDSIDFQHGIYRIRKTQIPVTGKMICYYSNGRKMIEQNFLNGLEHGIKIEWNEKGNIIAEHNFKYGQYFGKQTTYYETGQIMSEQFYKFDREDSTFTQYYPNGKIESLGKYKFTDQDLSLIQQFKTDTISIKDSDEVVTGFKIRTDESYKPKNGVWKYWDEKGNLVKEELYKDGQLVK